MLKEIFQGVTKIVYTVVFFMGLVNVFLATKNQGRRLVQALPVDHPVLSISGFMYKICLKQ
jgi:hypothetical protein